MTIENKNKIVSEREFQAACDELVNREVIHCCSMMVSEIAKNPSFMDDDDVMNLVYSREKENKTLPENVYLYQIHLDERDNFYATVEKVTSYDIENDSVLGTEEVFAIRTVEDLNYILQFGGFMSDKTDVDGLREKLENDGVIPKNSILLDDESKIEFEVETETEEREIYEHWIVSNWLKDKLQEKGETVGDLFDFNVWGRTTTGQAIAMDYVIRQIISELKEIESDGKWSN